jgi:SPP1 family predicted phage head-tail adaptor
MKTGDFDKCLTFSKPSKIPDGQGGFKQGFAEAGHTWGAFRNLQANTEEEAGAITSQIKRKILVRKSTLSEQIHKGWKAAWKTRLFDVEHAYPDEYDRGLIVVIVKEVVK